MGDASRRPYRARVAQTGTLNGNASPATAWPQILLIYLCGLVAAGQLGLVPPLLPALQRDLGIALATGGAMTSIITMVGAACGVVAGRWTERIGQAHALGLGILIMALAAALCAIAPEPMLLLAARGLAGLGYVLTVIAAPSLMAHLSKPDDQPVALALWGTFVPAGIAVAQALAGSFADEFGWRGLFWLDAVLLLMMLFCAHAALPPVHRPVSRDASPAITRRPMAIRASLAFLCFALVFLALAGLLPVYLMEIREHNEAQAGQIAALMTASGILGSLIAGWQMRRGASARALTMVGLLVPGAVTWLIFPAVMPTWVALAAAAAAFVAGGFVPAAIFAWVPQLVSHPGAIAPMNGLIAQCGSLGSLLGPPLLAIWVSALGWSAAPVFLLAIAIAGVLCLRRTA